MPRHQMESNPPVAESNRDSNTRRAARHGRLLELDEDSETSTCALQVRRSAAELIQRVLLRLSGAPVCFWLFI